jgi:hypothetical protein
MVGTCPSTKEVKTRKQAIKATVGEQRRLEKRVDGTNKNRGPITKIKANAANTYDFNLKATSLPQPATLLINSPRSFCDNTYRRALGIPFLY